MADKRWFRKKLFKKNNILIFKIWKSPTYMWHYFSYSTHVLQEDWFSYDSYKWTLIFFWLLKNVKSFGFVCKSLLEPPNFDLSSFWPLFLPKIYGDLYQFWTKIIKYKYSLIISFYFFNIQMNRTVSIIDDF